jgi:hypothetical protein
MAAVMGGWKMIPRTAVICCNALSKCPHPADASTAKDIQAIAIRVI